MFVKVGSTRRVFILKNIVIKIPNYKKYRLFLHGILANLQEHRFSQLKRRDLCPVIYCSKLGLFLIMKKADVFSNSIDQSIFKNIINNKYIYDNMKNFMVNDLKPNNYGIYNNHLVKIDYGN